MNSNYHVAKVDQLELIRSMNSNYDVVKVDKLELIRSMSSNYHVAKVDKLELIRSMNSNYCLTRFDQLDLRSQLQKFPLRIEWIIGTTRKVNMNSGILCSWSFLDMNKNWWTHLMETKSLKNTEQLIRPTIRNIITFIHISIYK